MDDRDVTVPHCQVKRSLLVLRKEEVSQCEAKNLTNGIQDAEGSTADVSDCVANKPLLKERNTLTSPAFTYLIPEVWVGIVL